MTSTEERPGGDRVEGVRTGSPEGVRLANYQTQAVDERALAEPQRLNMILDEWASKGYTYKGIVGNSLIFECPTLAAITIFGHMESIGAAGVPLQGAEG